MWYIPSWHCCADKSLSCWSPLKLIWLSPFPTLPSPKGSSEYERHMGKQFSVYLQKRCFPSTLFTETHVVISQLFWTEKVLQTVLLRRQRFLSTEFLQAGFLFLLVQGTCKQQSYRRHILFKGQKMACSLKKGTPCFLTAGVITSVEKNRVPHFPQKRCWCISVFYTYFKALEILKEVPLGWNSIK